MEGFKGLYGMSLHLGKILVALAWHENMATSFSTTMKLLFYQVGYRLLPVRQLHFRMIGLVNERERARERERESERERVQSTYLGFHLI